MSLILTTVIIKLTILSVAEELKNRYDKIVMSEILGLSLIILLMP